MRAETVPIPPLKTRQDAIRLEWCGVSVAMRGLAWVLEYLGELELRCNSDVGIGAKSIRQQLLYVHRRHRR